MNVLSLSAKNCMSHLLLKDTFDLFSFIEGEITTFNTFTIDGFIQKDFFDEAPEDAYSRWRDLRDYCFGIIRGKRTPLNFRIVLSLPPDRYAAFLADRRLTGCRPEEIQGLYLNFRYDGTNLQCVTGISLRGFTMDKSLEKEWDVYARELFVKMGIDVESLV